MRRLKYPLTISMLALAGTSLTVTGQTASESKHKVDSYEATTVDMTPAGVTLKFDVLQWQEEAALERLLLLR